MGIQLVGDWSKLQAIAKDAPKRLNAALQKALLQEGQFFRAKIVEGFREQAPGGQAFQPLAETTLATRRSQGFKGTKALIRNADLRNSVTVVRDGTRVFVGVLRSARTKGGESLVNIAAVHEYGSRPIVIRLTDKMRKRLHAMMRAGGLPEPATPNTTGIIVIQVPARPFLAPIWKMYGEPPEKVGQRFMSRVAHLLNADFGLLGPPPPRR